jgi:hypothetical protein
MKLSKRLACRAVGLPRSTYARIPIALTPADPDADLRATLRIYAREHPVHGFRRAWAHLKHDQGVLVNKKKVHRLWKEEGLQVRIYHPRKRAGVSTMPQIEADAPKVVWALDFQFDSTVDGKAIKICSMLDGHTRLSLMNIVERSITAERLTVERPCRARGVLAMVDLSRRCPSGAAGRALSVESRRRSIREAPGLADAVSHDAWSAAPGGHDGAAAATRSDGESGSPARLEAAGSEVSAGHPMISFVGHRGVESATLQTRFPGRRPSRPRVHSTRGQIPRRPPHSGSRRPDPW